MKDHFIYEIALHRVLKKALIKYDKVFNKLLDDMNESKDYLEELKLNREEYLDLEEDCLNDIYFTIKTTCQLLYLTQKYLVKIKKVRLFADIKSDILLCALKNARTAVYSSGQEIEICKSLAVLLSGSANAYSSDSRRRLLLRRMRVTYSIPPDWWWKWQ